MSHFILDHHNRPRLAAALKRGDWVIACLCAAWCDSCRQYQPAFAALAQRHPDKCLVWIDIEDQADLVGDIEVENFPTLLIQRADTIAFFGSVTPDARVADRLIAALAEKTATELAAQAGANDNQDRNLRRLLAAADGA